MSDKLGTVSVTAEVDVEVVARAMAKKPQLVGRFMAIVSEKVDDLGEYTDRDFWTEALQEDTVWAWRFLTAAMSNEETPKRIAKKKAI